MAAARPALKKPEPLQSYAKHSIATRQLRGQECPRHTHYSAVMASRYLPSRCSASASNS